MKEIVKKKYLRSALGDTFLAGGYGAPESNNHRAGMGPSLCLRIRLPTRRRSAFDRKPICVRSFFLFDSEDTWETGCKKNRTENIGRICDKINPVHTVRIFQT